MGDVLTLVFGAGIALFLLYEFVAKPQIRRMYQWDGKSATIDMIEGERVKTLKAHFSYTNDEGEVYVFKYLGEDKLVTVPHGYTMRMRGNRRVIEAHRGDVVASAIGGARSEVDFGSDAAARLVFEKAMADALRTIKAKGSSTIMWVIIGIAAVVALYFFGVQSGFIPQLGTNQMPTQQQTPGEVPPPGLPQPGERVR